MDGATTAHQIAVRQDEPLQRRVDVEEIDVGDEAVDASIDASRLGPVHIAVGRI